MRSLCVVTDPSTQDLVDVGRTAEELCAITFNKSLAIAHLDA